MHLWHRLLAFSVVVTVGLSSCATAPPEDSGANEPEPAVEEQRTGESAAAIDGGGLANPVSQDHFYLAMQKLAEGNLVGARAMLVLHAAAGSGANAEEAEAGSALLDLLEKGPSGAATEPTASERLMLLNAVLGLINALEADREDLINRNQALAVDLEKREEALKRLRELTLGQQEG